MASGYNPYYGGPTNRQEAPLGLLEYQRMITQGDPNSPLFNAPKFTPRTGGDLRGVQSFGTIQQPEEQNVGTVASQIDANLSALEGADKARQLYEDTTFGFNAQQGEWPGTIWKDITDFGGDVATGAENVYTAGENLVTGSDKPMGLLHDDLMANMSTTPDKLLGGPETLAELGINPTTGSTTTLPTNAQSFNTFNPDSYLAGARYNSTGSNIGGSLGANLETVLPADMNTAKIFSPVSDPMNWNTAYDPATNSFANTGALREAAKAPTMPLGSASQLEGLANLPSAGSDIANLPLTDWNQLGTPAIQGNIDKLGQLGQSGQLMSKTGQAGAGVTAGADAAAGAGAGWGSKVLPGIGAGLSIYDMVEGGVNPGNVMGLGSALAFMAPASMALGPLGWALAGGSLLGSLFDWW